MGRRKKETSEGEKENALLTGKRDTVSVCIRKETYNGEALKELHIEVAATGSSEIVLKPRKRKERLDSGGSLNLERKVCFYIFLSAIIEGDDDITKTTQFN